MVNNNPNCLISYGNSPECDDFAKLGLAAPGRDREDAMSLAEIASGRRDDGALGEHEGSTSQDGLPDVLLTDEIERSGTVDGTV